jgi:hypothetical protein
MRDPSPPASLPGDALNPGTALPNVVDPTPLSLLPDLLPCHQLRHLLPLVI